MAPQPEQIKIDALKELQNISESGELENWRVRYLGRKGELTLVLRSLGDLPADERKATGASANKVKSELEESLLQRELNLKEANLASAGEDLIDVTLPGKPFPVGHLHPISQTIQEVSGIFASMGFQISSGPEVDWDHYVFDALNMPKNHPARDNMSSYWIDDINKEGYRRMLRTHCTSVSARLVESEEPPIRSIQPGRVYRYEAIDATHLNIYHNIDGIAVDKGITLADLKGTLYEFTRRYFGEDRKARFRCDFFPFVEPGVEMAIDCIVCQGQGCRLCGGSGWIEILGAGMTHPDVLKRGGIDPDVYSSFAFGMGVERLPMLRYGIDDIRLFYSNDLRFLKQF